MNRILALVFIILTGGNITAQITPHEAVSQMKKGINLGNTLEPPFEGDWNNQYARENYFNLYKEAGFDVVRVPVRWDEHTGYIAPYNVDKAWMDRVEEVVDWGLERDLFIVINAHHESWIKENYNNAAYQDRFDSIWSQIAVRFRDKSEKLIFEVLNEPRTHDVSLTKAENDELHQRILNIIRRTNPARLVVFQGTGWGSAEDLLEAAIPEDDFLIGSFHSYDPWPFGLTGAGPFGPAEINALKSKFSDVQDWSLANNIPVLLGEFGCHKEADYNLRMKHYFTYAVLTAEHGFTPCAWDDGGTFRIMERQTSGWNEIKDILIHSAADAPGGPKISLFQDTIIQLTWTNMVADHDSIIIERKTSFTSFSKYAVLPPDSTRFLDISPSQNLYYYYRIIAHYTDTVDLYSHPVRILVPEYVQKERGLFLGDPLPIPGIIEAEDFDLGGEGIAYHDADPLNIAGAYRPDEGVDIYDRLGDGYHIGNALPGEWYEYTVNVEQDGLYDLEFQLASTYSGGQFMISVGDAVSDTLESISSGSWLATTPVSTTMQLQAGTQIMRFSIIEEPQFNFDRIEFTLNTTGIGYAEKVSDLLVYKNLQGDLIIHSSEGSQFEMVRIYDMKGCLVQTLERTGQPAFVQAESMLPGIYVIHVLSCNRFYRIKYIHTH